jgi:DNA repair protein RecO (recombination protein O)
MSEIIKTEAVVLGKINYSESSLIVSLFTKSNGLVSAIIKGGRRPKSKLVSVVDVLNHIQIVMYRKESREIQIISSADLISYFPNVKSDLTTTSYAYAVVEIVKDLLNENEANELLFNGLVRILNLMEKNQEHPAILFGRFFIFFLREIGYELNLETCVVCSDPLTEADKPTRFFYEGFVCEKCKIVKEIVRSNDLELFNFLSCLKNKKKIVSRDEKFYRTVVQFLIDYLKSHVDTFNGLKSLTTF